MLTAPASTLDLPSGARAVARCDLLGVAPYSDMTGGLYRAWLTPAHAAALEALTGWMAAAGMAVRRDAIGNLIARYEGAAPGARTVLIGSHIDSVRDAGRYDGPLGIMLGIECVAELHRRGQRLPFAIEIVAFGDEEGSRFPAAMLCSRALAGSIAASALGIADVGGTSLTVAMTAFGLDAARALEARWTEPPLAYLEAHIEQGPVLEAEGLALGVVTGIAAQARYQFVLSGTAGHAGTTIMPLRRDALAAAAEIILAIERIAGQGPEDLVGTVGRIEARPGAANVIPGGVTLSLDVRALSAETRDRAAASIVDEASAIAERRGIALAATRVHELPAGLCDPQLVELLADTLQSLGHSPRRIASGAGHDAMVMAAACPTIMLFIRCAGGISHNPAEAVDPADADAAMHAMLAFLAALGERIVAPAA